MYRRVSGTRKVLQAGPTASLQMKTVSVAWGVLVLIMHLSCLKDLVLLPGG